MRGAPIGSLYRTQSFHGSKSPGPARPGSQDHFGIDPDKVEEDKRFDGIFVLRTNTDLNPLEAMLCYKQLWTVEQAFRTAKHLCRSSTSSTRPSTIRGHVFCSFLALVLKKALEDRVAAFGTVREASA
jgi:hypothetical protein